MVRHGQDLARLHAVAAARGGVVSSSDLQDCGFSADAVRRRVREGEWQRVGRAIVLAPALGKAPTLNDTGLAWILHFTFGAGTRISGALALRMARWSLPTEIHVVVLADKPHARIPGVNVVRRAEDGAPAEPGTLRFEPPRQALLDCLTVLPTDAATGLVDAALQRRYVRPEQLAQDLSDRLGRGRRNAAGLRLLMARATSGSRSEAEQRMSRLLRRSGTGPWIPNMPVRDSLGRVVAEIDFAHVGLRIAIEVDGRAFHSDHRAFEHDRQRQNALSIDGWLVLRFTWTQICEEPEAVIAAVGAAVAERQASFA